MNDTAVAAGDTTTHNTHRTDHHQQQPIACQYGYSESKEYEDELINPAIQATPQSSMMYRADGNTTSDYTTEQKYPN